MEDAAGGREFLVDTQQALLEEKARIARVAADGTGPFWKSLQLLLGQRVYRLRRRLRFALLRMSLSGRSVAALLRSRKAKPATLAIAL
jgi:hypothetical protein